MENSLSVMNFSRRFDKWGGGKLFGAAKPTVTPRTSVAYIGNKTPRKAGVLMKIVLLRSPGFLAPILRKVFKIPKEKGRRR